MFGHFHVKYTVMEHGERPLLRRDSFDIPRGLNPLLDELDLRFLAAGGASLAYRVGGSNALVKLNHQYPTQTITTAYEHGIPLEEAETLLLPTRRTRERRMIERRDKLLQFFNASVVAEQYSFVHFPFPGTVLRQILKREPARQLIQPADVHELRTVIRHQEYVNIAQPGTLNLSTRYAERRGNLDPRVYGRVTSQLMEGSHSLNKRGFDVADFLNVQQSPRLNQFVETLCADTPLRDRTIGFLACNKALMGSACEPIDFIGINNVFFQKINPHEWRVFITDGLYEENNRPWERASEALWKLSNARGDITSAEKEALLPMLNVARVHNALAILCDMPSLQLQPAGGMWCAPEFWEGVLHLLRTDYPAREPSVSSREFGRTATFACLRRST